MAVTEKHLEFLAAHRNGVLVTLKRDGRPQLSNIIYRYDAGSGRVQISVTADRAKTRNAERDPRVSLHVSAKDFWSWLVVEGEASLSAVATAPTDATVEALVELYRGLSGEHPDWEEYRAAMVAEQRQVLSFAVTHAYGQLPG
jgi:PPOX class probable F420-dependent enzyme